MRHLLRWLRFLGLLVIAPLASAGSNPESNLVRGYFLGFRDFVYISGDPDEYASTLLPICKSRGRLWALGVDAQLKCIATRRIEDNGEGSGPVYELAIKSDKPIRPSHALLYSTSPIAKVRWDMRGLRESELQELKNTANLKLKKYRKVNEYIDQGKAVAVEPRNGKLKIFILPWKITSDGIVDDKDYLIAVRSSSGEFWFKEKRGTIVGYIDIDGDGIPEIQNSMNCDGTCESVISVTQKFREVIAIYNH
jgi:hypothetical protein